MQKKLAINARQTNPDSPPELIRQYQIVVNVLAHYSRSSRRRPAVPKSDDYFRNVHKGLDSQPLAVGPNMKRLLKWRT